jgi:DNA-binding NarL/FixJ family response regulator
MNSSPSPLGSSSRPSARLLLIDEDSVFRLGLKVLLSENPAIVVVAEAEDGETALQILDHQFAPAFEPEPELPTNLVVLDLSLGRANPTQIQGLNLCRLLKSRYPSVAVLCIGASQEPVILAAVQQSGANGYCSKYVPAEQLVNAIQQVATGQAVWQQAGQQIVQETNWQGASERFDSPSRSRLPAPLAILRRNLRRNGIRQIETALAEVTAELENLELSLLDRAVLAGRQRELRLSRWLVQRLLATPSLPEVDSASSPASSLRMSPSAARQPQAGNQAGTASALATAALPNAGNAANAIVPTANAAIVETQSVQSVTFDTVLAKLQSGLDNQTEIPLEIDILRDDKKRDLFYLILRQLEELLSELRFSQVELPQLGLKRNALLLDLWQLALTDFFGKYYTVQVDGVAVEVVESLLQDAAIVEAAILDKIPGVIELLQHLLFQTPLAVNSVPYPVGNPESLARAELLLENLVIQVANAAIQPLLNRFANVEPIKQAFYNRRLLSSREIERFRNNLSWRYRIDRSFREPKNIFESQYRLFTLTGRGIKQVAIYAPRTDELADLSGLPYIVTLALETRDAIAPRLRSAFSFVGNSVVYVLTEVIGRGIGLVGRGVLKGLGNVWQDTSKRDRSG